MALPTHPGWLESRQAKASPASQPCLTPLNLGTALGLARSRPAAGTVPGADAIPLPAVCMFLEESSLGRQHWRQNLAALLRRLAATLRAVLRSQPAPSSSWACLVIKVRVGKEQSLRGLARRWP